MFKLKLEPVPDEETMAMESLWNHYAKTILRNGQEFEDQHPEVVTLTKAQEIHAWEDWAAVHFDLNVAQL